MAPLHFDEYEFCPEALTLLYRGLPVKLRPKTAVVLKRLLASPGELVDKASLLEAAWGDRWVADQNLFQAISELRSLLAPLKPIVTYPNRGYAWSLPVDSRAPVASPKHHRWMPVRALAAALALSIGVAAFHGGAEKDAETTLPLSPSVQAFQLGISTLDRSPERAADYFRVALREDPDFGEAQLLLAQSLFAAGLLDQARTEAQHLYVRTVDQELAYLQVSVMGLLSRLDEAAGVPNPAFDWAQSAWEKASSEGFACAASAARQRLVDLIAAADLSEQHFPEALRPTQNPETLMTAESGQNGCDPLLGETEPVKAAKSDAFRPTA
ncbi:MAG: winged helix-turn-helix domain-containing protein [Pseudomonadota bacterium]